jgi:hypothetical protein
MGTLLAVDQDFKSIATRDTAGWVHNNRVTRRSAFWVQDFLNT